MRPLKESSERLHALGEGRNCILALLRDMPMRTMAVFVLLLASTVLHAQQPPLTLVQTLELPGVEGRIDHLAVELDSQRLFVAALGNNSVEVIDLRANAFLKSLKGFREPQGILVVGAPKTLVVANGQGGSVQFLRLADFTIANTVAPADDADNLRYDSAGRVYVGYGDGALVAIDPSTGKRMGDIKLAGHPEAFQLEKTGRRIFVNVPTAGHIAVVDRDAMKVATTWPITEARSNFPMALDEGSHRLFIGCRQPAKVLIVDTSSGKVTGS